MKHIESRPSKVKANSFDFYVTARLSPKNFQSIIDHLAKTVEVHSLFDHKPSVSDPAWFPRTIDDLDAFATRILDAGGELQADHPGFRDAVYRARRNELAELAIKYRHHQPIPTINYSDEETKTW